MSPDRLSPAAEVPTYLVLGTRNPKKRRELEDLLAPLGIRIGTLDDHPESVVVEETGTSFAENAARKATIQARAIGEWVLGEDSGICVNALGGAPGIHSARFAGEPSQDDANNALLLARLADVPAPDRTAHYVCHVALADPAGQIVWQTEALCRGRITCAPRGRAGFGYDPLFEIPEYHRTFGELGERVKSVISHRARALRAFARFLQAYAPPPA